MYGKLVNGEIEYFKPFKGGIHYEDKVIFTNDESEYNKCGWYRVEGLEGEGTDYQKDNVIYHYSGGYPAL